MTLPIHKHTNINGPKERPMHTATVPPFTLEVFYEYGHHRYRVAIRQDGEVKAIDYVRATYEPQFGIDAADMDEINARAEDLCVMLEKQP